MTDPPGSERAESTASGRPDTSRPPVRVLHVDDEPDFAELVTTFLERTDEAIEVVTEGDVDAALSRLSSAAIDCVVSDYQMPGRDGLDLLESVRAADPDLPFILFTGKGSEEIASEAISAGVTDYLQKGSGSDQFDILANRISNAVSRYRAERDLEARVEQQAVIASLGQRALEGVDLETLFEEAVEAVHSTLDVDFVKVLELDRAADVFHLRAGVGWEAGLVGEATVGTGGDSQAGFTLTATEPVVVEDLAGESRFDGPPLLVDHDVRSGVSVVIGPRDDPWGVFGVHTTDRRPFTFEEVTFVQSVAHVLAEAVRRREVESRLRENEERFRRMAEASPDVIFRTDRDGVFTYVSRVVEEILGYDPAELEGTHFGEIVHDSSVEAAVEGFQQVLGGDQAEGLRVEIRRQDGTTVSMEIDAVPFEVDGEVVEVIGFTREVTGPVEE